MNGETRERQLEKLRRDLGKTFLNAFEGPETIEIARNANGTLWHERLGEPMKAIGFMNDAQAEAVIRTVAACLETTITRDNATIECEFPLDGSRFAGEIPPVVSSPVFCIRKRASRVFTLEEYVASGIVRPEQKETLCQAIHDHRNILVTGGTGSGKTTLVNSLIHELTDQFPAERLVIIEDTGELQCAALNYLQFHTTPTRSMTDLVRHALRVRPDRILVGEVRGAEALDLLMSWNTGHQGGIATLHANNAEAGLTRLLTLVSMNPSAPRQIEPLIGEAVDIIVHIARTRESRVVRELVAVYGYDSQGYRMDRQKEHQQ